jgi:NAD(P)-dependent dehydrogenase (short-subunit alcohol dehydrogenase family)
MKAEIAQMLKQGGGGAIVNTSSTAGLVGSAGGPAYTAAKHGVAGLTKTAALEYGKHRIRVNAVCPGPIRTPMMQRIMRGSAETEQRISRSEPLKRFGESLQGCTPQQVDRFYCDNFVDLMGNGLANDLRRPKNLAAA